MPATAPQRRARTSRRLVLTAAILCTVALGAPCLAAPPQFDVFYVAVGSEHYVSSMPKGAATLPDVRGAVASARRVSGLLSRAGARFGVVLESDPTHLLRQEDVWDALDRVTRAVRRSKASHPLIVFYLAGHGISEGVAWHQYFLPGNLQLPATPLSAKELEGLHGSAILIAELADKLETRGWPYILLVDICHSGARGSFRAPAFSEQGRQVLRNEAPTRRHLYELHQSSPVLFAAAPGTVVTTVPDPRDADMTLAPLARRLTLVADAAAQSRAGVSLGGLVRALAEPALDPATRPAVTHAEADPHLWEGMLLRPAPSPDSRTVTYLGSADGAVRCCTYDSAAGPAPYRYRATLTLSGEEGEYISAGRKIDAVEVGTSGSVTFPKAGVFWAHMQVGDEYWSVHLATPDGAPFRVQGYPDANRFGDDHLPSIDVSGGNRGCGETAGHFEVLAIARDAAGVPTQFAATFEQTCGSGNVPLRGRIAVERSGP